MSLFPVYSLFDITPVSAKGMYLMDVKGNKYLDLYGGHAVISIGHSHPKYVDALKEQIYRIGFYSNSVKNELQEQLAIEISRISGCKDYQLFMCNSGAEANENALKLASFQNKRHKILAFKNGFHGRTSAAVAATDNPKIITPLNSQQEVDFLAMEDLNSVEKILKEDKTCAVIVEVIQGVGGLDEGSTEFYKGLKQLCDKHNVLLIADEVQSGFGRTGDFFAFQKHGIEPDIISMAKGMGNGFPVGGILIHPKIEATMGMLGTTFGGNQLACTAALSVLEVIEDEFLMDNANSMHEIFIKKLKQFDKIKATKGRGLMIGLEFDFNIKSLREELVYKHKIFTGNSKNPNLLRILPPLTINESHIDAFIDALKKELD